MVQWLNRISMSDDVAHKAFLGELDSIVDFTYINVKTYKEVTHSTTLNEAILLAEYRRDDKRYRNFEFYIS